MHKPFVKFARVAPRDAASGLPTGKFKPKPVNATPVGPRDLASGQPTGKLAIVRPAEAKASPKKALYDLKMLKK